MRGQHHARNSSQQARETHFWTTRNQSWTSNGNKACRYFRSVWVLPSSIFIILSLFLYSSFTCASLFCWLQGAYTHLSFTEQTRLRLLEFIQRIKAALTALTGGFSLWYAPMVDSLLAKLPLFNFRITALSLSVSDCARYPAEDCLKEYTYITYI